MMNTSTSEPDLDDLAAMISATAYVAMISDVTLMNDLVSAPDHRLALILLLARRGNDADAIMTKLNLKPGDIARCWESWTPR